MKASSLWSLPLLLSAVIFSSACVAEPRCQYSPDFVSSNYSEPVGEGVQGVLVQREDPTSGETVKSLTLSYPNGDVAVITHKYCEMYNFEVNYFRSSGSNAFDSAQVGSVLMKLFDAYSQVQAEFTPGLDEIVASAFDEQMAVAQQQFSVGLSEDYVVDSPGVEYAVGMKSIGDVSSDFGSVINFYWGVGGL